MRPGVGSAPLRSVETLLLIVFAISVRAAFVANHPFSSGALHPRSRASFVRGASSTMEPRLGPRLEPGLEPRLEPRPPQRDDDLSPFKRMPPSSIMKSARLTAEQWRDADSSPLAAASALHDALHGPSCVHSSSIAAHGSWIALHEDESGDAHFDFVLPNGVVDCPLVSAAERPGAFASAQVRARLVGPDAAKQPGAFVTVQTRASPRNEHDHTAIFSSSPPR